MSARRLVADTEGIAEAARLLRAGALVAFPTETVYGLAADALNDRAVARIFEAKKRPTFDPLIVHVPDAAEARALWLETPPLAEALMKAFWPGPLTLVLPKRPQVPDIVTAGLPSVALRVPSHPVALAFLKAAGRPIAAPSANPFGRTSPTTAEHVMADLGEAIDAVLDAGSSPVGIESTVLLVQNGRASLLRAGGLALEDIRRVTGDLSVPPLQTAGSAPLSPGLLDSHYAPRTPMTLLENTGTFFDRLVETRRALKKKPRLGFLGFDSAPPAGLFDASEVLSATGDLREAAANLFSAMRRLDGQGLEGLFAAPVPERGLGVAIMDRLRKASAGNTHSIIP